MLYRLGRDEEAEEWTRRSEQATPPEDVTAQAHWRSIRAKVLARRGEANEAVRLSAEAVEWIRRSDDLHFIGDCLVDRAEVLWLLGRRDEARPFLAVRGPGQGVPAGEVTIQDRCSDPPRVCSGWTRPAPQFGRRDPKGHPPQPPLGRGDPVLALQSQGEGLGDRVPRDLRVARVGEHRSPQPCRVFDEQALDLVLVRRFAGVHSHLHTVAPRAQDVNKPDPAAREGPRRQLSRFRPCRNFRPRTRMDEPMDKPSVARLPIEDRFLAAIELFEPAARAELLAVLTSSEIVRADLIRQLWERREAHPIAELLMDLEADRAAQAVLVGLLRESLQ